MGYMVQVVVMVEKEDQKTAPMIHHYQRDSSTDLTISVVMELKAVTMVICMQVIESICQENNCY